MAFSLSRNAKLYVTTSQTIAAMTNANTWEIPVLDGFNFTANTAIQEIEISEAGETPVRGQQVFTTAIEPVDWSLQAYMRPRFNTLNTQVDAVERILWEALAAKPTSSITTNADGGATGASVRNEGSAGGLEIDFDQSNTNELLNLSLVFNLGTSVDPVWYHIYGVVVDTAEVDFAIDAIASITWGGFGTNVSEVTDSTDKIVLSNMLTDGESDDWLDSGFPDGTAGYLAAPTGVQACIRNKLSTVSIVGKSGTDYANSYTLALTGGTLSIANNITFLTPEALGVVNNPCGHFTGQRVISGNMTAYLKTGGANDTADLLNDIITHSNSASGADPTDFELTINVGGSAPASPYDTPIVQFTMPGAHLVIPTINIEDVVSVDIPFNALPYTGTAPDPAAANELTVAYYADES